jgi:hypothetical protein
MRFTNPTHPPSESAFNVTKADPGWVQYNEGLSVPDLGTPLAQ